jgi:predicted ATPase/DNA-binding SARP family transcriptional activator
MQVDVRLLGGFEVVVDGRPVPARAWSRKQAAALVKLLALSLGHRLHREQVIDALWPDLLLDEATPRLHKAAHFARGALGAPDGVVLVGDVVSLFPNATLSVDLDRFDAAADAARDDPERATEAVGLYGGELLPDDPYEPWAETARIARRLRYLELLRRLARWEDVLAVDPTDEEAHLHLVRERIRRGDRGGALRQLEWLEAAVRQAFDGDLSDTAAALRAEVLAMPVDGLGSAAQQVSGMVPVPRPATPTVGRDGDIERASELLARSRIVTLVGPGGVGKTRLAVEVALAVGARAGGDACFVDLTKVRDASLVVGLIVRELGVHVESDADAAQLLEEALRGRELLLVLDNFEHVIDAAGVVGQIVRWAPAVRVLATSRTRLRVAGEQVVDVEPLPIVDDRERAPAAAVALFEQAATALDPGFRLESCLPDVVAICATVDGLPLAIELAAGHIRTLPPALLVARLGSRLGSPGTAARDAPARQQTVPATIDWSLQLLGPRERQLFARLGVFSGPVSLDAVEQVCGDPGDDVIDALARLVEQSLVRRVAGRDGQPRFTMLELVRERARELLTGDAAELTASRHAGYYTSFVEDLEESRWRESAACWIDLITESLPEIRAAHAHARAAGDTHLAARMAANLGTYWHREGHYVDGREWVAHALARADELDQPLAAKLETAAGFVEWPRDAVTARRHWVRAGEMFRELGDHRYLAYALALTSATYCGDREQYDAAIRLCDESIALARRVGDAPLIAQALNIRGELTRVEGHDELADVAYREGLEVATAAGDNAHASVFLANLSYFADHAGHYTEARRLGCDALRLCWSLGRRMMAAWTISELAGPELGLGRPERGVLLVGAADEALRVLGATRHPVDRSEHERVVRGLRGALGDDAYAALYERGARMTLDEAVTLALLDPEDGPDPGT